MLLETSSTTTKFVLSAQPTSSPWEDRSIHARPAQSPVPLAIRSMEIASLAFLEPFSTELPAIFASTIPTLLEES